MEETNVKKPKKVLKTIGNIIFFVFIALMAIVIVLSIISKKTGKQIFSYSMMWVLTDCMEPTIEEQSYILVKKVDVNSLKKDDVITFKSHNSAIEGNFNTHRIYEVVEQGKEFITKGDNCAIPDTEHVYSNDIAYKYVCNLTLLTFFGRIYSTTLGLFLTVGVIFFFILIYLAITINRFKKEVNDKSKQKEIDKLVQEEVKRLEEQNKRNKKHNE
ncbi:MAG: signal peptidase I [Firmicutes bacterium]|nr:signal peptidase I [Candidatus Caballimonas caccae]